MGTRSIAITAWNRLPLFRNVLTDIAANDLDGWRVHIRIEPSDKAELFVAAAQEILAGRQSSIVVNETRLGVRQNTLRAMDDAFGDGAELALYMEEDLRMAPDATALVDWFVRNHQPGWLGLSLLAGTCGVAGYLSNPLHPDVLFLTRAFNGFGFAVRRQEWEARVRAAWAGTRSAWPAHVDHRVGWEWDWGLQLLLLLQYDPSLRMVQPAFARATHEGRIGINTQLEFYYRAFSNLPVATTSGHDFRLVDVDKLPHELKSHLWLLDAYMANTTALELERDRGARSLVAITRERVSGAARRFLRKSRRGRMAR